MATQEAIAHQLLTYWWARNPLGSDETRGGRVFQERNQPKRDVSQRSPTKVRGLQNRRSGVRVPPPLPASYEGGPSVCGSLGPRTQGRDFWLQVTASGC